MPTIGWGHSHYWAGASGAAPPDAGLGASAGGGYVPWQTSIILRGLMMLAGLLLA